MKKVITIVILVAFAVLPGFAQSGKVITAFNLYTAYQQSNNKDKKSLEDAYTNINEASQDASTSTENKTWYYKGFICQLIYQDSILQPKYPNALFEAMDAYEKVVELSEQPGGKKKFVDDSYENLGIVSGQMYNYGLEAYFKQTADTTAFKAFQDVLALNDYLTKHNQQAKFKAKEDNADYILALTAMRMKNDEVAKTYFNKLINMKLTTLNSKKAYMYQYLADIYTNEKNDQKAIEVLDQGIKEFPDSSNLTINKLNIFLHEGRAKDALDIMTKAIQLEPNNAQLYFILGHTYAEMKDTVSAIESYNKAIKIDPKDADAFNNLGALYVAKANLLVDILADPNIKDADYQRLDDQRKDLLKQALPYLETASQLAPKDIYKLNLLKTIYAKLGDYDKVGEVKKKMDDLERQGIHLEQSTDSDKK